MAGTGFLMLFAVILGYIFNWEIANTAFAVMGIVFAVTGLKILREKSDDLNENPLPILIGAITVIFLMVFLYIAKNNQPVVSGSLSEPEARVIAERTCIKGGESLAPGYHNESTKTWWFDANLNAVREGCNPACVVSEETKQAEINWRCTGLIVP